jgi:hypothetical protein
MKRISLVLICLLFILFAASCGAENSGVPSDADLSDIPPDIETVNVPSDRTIFKSFQQVEENSTIIVEAVAKEHLGQYVEMTYDDHFKRELPGVGYTKWEIEVTKVYKGDVKIGDKLPLLLQYYIWTEPDGKKQLITGSSLKPAVKNKEYLLFLVLDDDPEGYWPVCDYEGMFPIPTGEMKAKAKDGTLTQSDFDVYDGETLHYLIPIYRDAVRKYFD